MQRYIAETSSLVGGHCDCNLAYAIAELSILIEFENELNQKALDVPSINESPKPILEVLKGHWNGKVLSNERIFWPVPALLQIMSLAQHHQLPTRLLDWTRTAFTAAYFAAIPEDSKSNELVDNACVWALRATDLDKGWTFRKGAPNLNLVEVPRKTNPNAHAQDGVFTRHGPYGENLEPWDKIKRYPLEEIIPNINESAQRAMNDALLLKFTFPRAACGEVLWWLKKEGVTASRLFPGHDGASRSVQERQFSMKPCDFGNDDRMTENR